MQRTAAFAVLGMGLGSLLATGAGARTNLVVKDFTGSRILVGPPYANQIQGQVAPDTTLTVSIQVEDINDPAAQHGVVDITVNLSEVVSTVDVVGLTPDCSQPTTGAVACHIQLPDLPPPVAVPTEAIKLRARAGSPVGPAGSIYLDWTFNGAPAPTMATIAVQIIPALTPTLAPTTNPPPTTVSTQPTTPAVIKPRPTRTTPLASPSPSPTLAVTMTPDPTAAPNLDGVDPIAGPAAAPIAAPSAYPPAWRSPALMLSLGTAAGGLLIALLYAIISLRKAAKD
jgi:hypothetical protein